MKKVLFLSMPMLVALCTPGLSSAQNVIQDKGLNGQLKRMVFIKWDDWAPNTAIGKAYWLAQHKYKGGDDLRPYRVGGTFDQEYALLTEQEKYEEKVRDSVKAMAEEEARKLVAMSGGVLDVAYSTHFKSIFDDLTNEVEKYADKLRSKNSDGWEAWNKDRYVKQYREEYLPIMKERIELINKGIAEQGDRILSYVELQRAFEAKNRYMMNLCKMYFTLVPNKEAMSQPTPEFKEHRSDAQIKDDLLKRIKI